MKDYITSPIKLARPNEVGLVNYQHETSFYNITAENTCFRMRRWRYATTHIGEYFPGKCDENMIEYKNDVFHPLCNYELEEIIENLNSRKKLKNSRTKLSIDRNKLKVRLLSEWDIDFTVPNFIASVLGFENKVLRVFTEHLSDFPAELFQLKTINIYCHLVNSNIVDLSQK